MVIAPSLFHEKKIELPKILLFDYGYFPITISRQSTIGGGIDKHTISFAQDFASTFCQILCDEQIGSSFHHKRFFVAHNKL